jgi:hypothetical protein
VTSLGKDKCHARWPSVDWSMLPAAFQLSSTALRRGTSRLQYNQVEISAISSIQPPWLHGGSRTASTKLYVAEEL